MENKQEEVVPQNPATEETTEVETEVVVEETKTEEKEDTLSTEDLEELKKKADVSSQNFERAKKAEARVKELELLDNDSSSEFEDEDVNKLKNDVTALQSELGQSKLIKKYPQLEETWGDFEKYQQEPENAGMKLETAAKAFLVDKDLLGTRRKGLEKTTGGSKVPQSTGMSLEDIENIRKNDGPKYREMLKKGQIKFKE
jgi:hypothetical protein